MSLTLKSDDVKLLVQIIANQAASAPAAVGPSGYLRDLVNRSNLRADLKMKRGGGWTGDALFDARELVNWAIAKGVNPVDQGSTTLGSILTELLSDVGYDEAKQIAALMVAYRLYLDDARLSVLIMRYQIPIAVGALAEPGLAIGPEITWRGPTDEVRLQSFRKPQPDFLDVGFLIQAIKAAESVCRIEGSNKEKRGTGFLIASDLLLTNYHVLKPNDQDDMDKNASDFVLRFGCITAPKGKESEGQTFRLTANHPIVHSSPVQQLDYALLRIESKIKGVEGIRVAAYEGTQVPLLNSGLNILQHPGGDALKIALDVNGVTFLDEKSGVIQYYTNAAAGSSGSPCFNSDWNVVALHHAERARWNGAIREGILLKSILKEIQADLV